MRRRTCRRCGLPLRKGGMFMGRWCSQACHDHDPKPIRWHKKLVHEEEGSRLIPLPLPPPPREGRPVSAPPISASRTVRRYEAVLTFDDGKEYQLGILLKATTPEAADEEGFALADDYASFNKELRAVTIKRLGLPERIDIGRGKYHVRED